MSRKLLVDDPVISSLLGPLSRAALIGHSGRSFLEHLLCTWRILADWRMPTDVCRAGFLHSAYATSFYPRALFSLEDRETVRNMIGREAEELAFRFCTMDRRNFWDELAKTTGRRRFAYADRQRGGARVLVSRNVLVSLLIIESANIAEQSKAADFGPAPWMSRVLRWWEFLDNRSIPVRLNVRPRLTRRADKRAIQTYLDALKCEAASAIPLLEEAIDQNPWAAEPRILRAVCGLDTKDKRAPMHAQAGADLISAWAVAWDKRFSANAWKALSDRANSLSTKPISRQLNYNAICAILSGQAPKPRWLRV